MLEEREQEDRNMIIKNWISQDTLTLRSYVIEENTRDIYDYIHE